jgi:hypothetical protein
MTLLLWIAIAQIAAASPQTPRDIERIDRNQERILSAIEKSVDKNATGRDEVVGIVVKRIDESERALLPTLDRIANNLAALNKNIESALRLADEQRAQGRREVFERAAGFMSNVMTGLIFPALLAYMGGRELGKRRRARKGSDDG